jgi:putative methyltransferase (TIGR04325 family)
MKELLKHALPASARSWLRRTFPWRWFQGDYANWAEARRHSVGYDDAAVLERVRTAARAARDGRAAWDRDGIAFPEPAVHAPLLAALHACAADAGGRLDLVDFGGGLGGTWRQYRAALSGVAAIRWCVVEQPHFVAVGRTEFTDGVLQFQPTLAEAGTQGPQAVILFSGVLQYLATPHALMAEAIQRGFRHVILDRTPFWGGARDWLTVQRTPPELGGGGYPCWVFDRARLTAPLAANYGRVAEWPGFDEVDRRMQFLGMHFVRRPGAS